MELSELGLHLVAMPVMQAVELLPLVDDFVEAQMDGGEAIIDPGEEQMGFPPLLTCPFDDELDQLQAELRQLRQVDATEQLATHLGQLFPHGAGKIQLGDQALQLVTQPIAEGLLVFIALDGLGGCGWLHRLERYRAQQQGAHGLLVELKQASNLALMLREGVGGILVEKFARLAAELLRHLPDAAQMAASLLQGFAGQAHRLFDGDGMLLQQPLDDGDLLGQLMQRCMIFKALPQLGQPVVEFAIVPTTGVGQAGEQLERAQSLGFALFGEQTKFQLFLLEPFP